jgi:hypothetical protein
LKQALIVDPHGAVEDFAQNALGLYERTVVGSLQDAVAFASSADYHLVLIAQPPGICPGAMWAMVEQITRLAAAAAFVIVQAADDTDVDFHSRAAELGVTVLGAPLGVTARTLINEVSAG